MLDRLLARERRFPRRPSPATTAWSPHPVSPDQARSKNLGESPRSHAAGKFTLALLISTFLVSCLGPTPIRRKPGYSAPTQVSGRAIFAASTLSPEIEAEHLQRAVAKPALLRRAWLELQLGRPDAALDSTAAVLYSADRASTNEESFARYLRAEAYRKQGLADRSRYDRDRARELALDPELQRRLLPRNLPRTPTGQPWGALAVAPRATWNPAPKKPDKLDPMQRPSRVTIHHSAMYFRSTRARACADMIGRIQHQHMTAPERRYGDIGYHFLIDPHGRIWEGRELRYQGAHAGGSSNIGNIGICLLGNFVRQRNGQGPTPAQVESMDRLVSQLMHHYGMSSKGLYCHSDFKATECPGPLMRPLVRRLAQRLQRGGRGNVPVAHARDE